MNDNFRNFKYKIEINEEGDPYVLLPENYVDSTEDKFMIVNLCASIIEHTYESLDIDEIKKYLTDKEELDNEVDNLHDLVVYLSGISYNMGELLKDKMGIESTIKDLIGVESIEVENEKKEESDDEEEGFNNKKYHVIVKNAAERDALPDVNIISGEGIYKRVEGFRVYVKTTRKIYELQGGITNKHWKIIG